MEITKQQSTSLKGVAVILLLIHHLFGFTDQFPEMENVIHLGKINGIYIETYIGIFGKICVSMFIFLSGYGLAAKNNISYSYIFYRLKKIYLFYWVTIIIFVSVGTLFIVSSGFTFDIYFFLSDLSGITHHYNVSTWFFTTYVLCLLLAPRIINIKINKLIIISILILIVSYIAMKHRFKWSFGYYETYMTFTGYFYYLASFIAGIIFNKIKIRKSEKFIYYISCLLFLTVSFFFPKSLAASSVITPFFIIILLPIVSAKYISQFFSFLGEKSLGIWLTHTYFYYYFFTKEIYALKYSLVILSVVILLSLFATYLCDKIVNILNYFVNHLVMLKKPIK